MSRFVFAAILIFNSFIAYASAQTTLASVGNISAVFVADPAPIHDGDLVGGTLRLVSDEGTLITGFYDVIFKNVHQVFVDGDMPGVRIDGEGGCPCRYNWGTSTSTWDFWFEQPTSNRVTLAEMAPDWPMADTYISVRLEDVGGFFGPSTESQSRDRRTDLQQLSTLDERATVTGLGGLEWYGDESGFFLHEPLWTNSIDVAHVVGVPGTVSELEFVVLGTGIEDIGCERSGQACFSFEIAWPVPEPSFSTAWLGIFAVVCIMRIKRKNAQNKRFDRRPW